jgi:dTDP-4-dehydrorhamnose 3,5-epimerase
VTVEQLDLPGAWLIRSARHHDERGSFTRVADFDVLRELGITLDISQVSYASNPHRGTVRGMHYQVGASAETKLIWCFSGRAHDVLVDVRPDSPTFGSYVSVELSAGDPTAVLVSPGLAHGYQTLEPDTSLGYLIDAPYDPAAARVLRWDDPVVGIAWPLPLGPISQRDGEAGSWPPAS